MIYKNKNNLDLQKIATILNENNIDFLLKKRKIVLKSNSIKFDIECDQKEIIFEHITPFWFYLLFFAITSLIVSLAIWLSQGEGYFIWFGGAIGAVIGHLVYKFKPSVLKEKREIIGIILKYKQ